MTYYQSERQENAKRERALGIAVQALRAITNGAAPEDDHDGLAYAEIERIGAEALGKITGILKSKSEVF